MSIMRNFNGGDKIKKKSKIQIEENPGNLSQEMLLHLEEEVKASLKDGYLSCPTAWKIAKDLNIPKMAVGKMADNLGIRIANCQIGFFKVDKTSHNNLTHKNIDDAIIATLETFGKNNELTCAKIFELASESKLTPMTISDVANSRNLKIRSCQLGCF